MCVERWGGGPGVVVVCLSSFSIYLNQVKNKTN